MNLPRRIVLKALELGMTIPPGYLQLFGVPLNDSGERFGPGMRPLLSSFSVGLALCHVFRLVLILLILHIRALCTQTKN